MPMSVAAAIERCEPEPGEVILLNDPFAGGSHLPDLTMVTPVDAEDRIGFVATRAHHQDIGGMSPGSMPLAVETYQEGIAIPPVRIIRSGEWEEELLAVLARNVRAPEQFRADLRAQAAANSIGASRLRLLDEREGRSFTEAAMAALIDYSERAMRAAIAEIPDGTHRAEDVLESMAAPDERIHIRVAIRIEGDEAVADFSGTDPQVAEPVNAVLPITVSAVIYCFLCLLDDEVPVNAGCFRPLRLEAEEGSVVNARPPAAVSAGNVETSQRIVDVVFRALAHALPDIVPAAGQGTMNNVTFGGYDPARGLSFAYYETLGGGMGASPLGDGLSGVHVAMSNTLNTPVEAFESELPIEIIHYRLRKDSGGTGRCRGGDGLERGYRFLVPVRGSVVSERRAVAPWGLHGGGAGKPGRNMLNGVELPAKAEFSAQAGDILTIETPGGGGFGKDDG
jgi:N-methylhydantoinase B